MRNNRLSKLSAIVCMTLLPIGARGINISIVTSAKADSTYLVEQTESTSLKGVKGGLVVCLFPEIKYQTFYGFGTSMSDANAEAAMQLSPQKRKEAIRLLFSKNDGNGYVFCRVPMGSNDFSTCDYSCVEKEDK